MVLAGRLWRRPWRRGADASRPSRSNRLHGSCRAAPRPRSCRQRRSTCEGTVPSRAIAQPHRLRRRLRRRAQAGTRTIGGGGGEDFGPSPACFYLKVFPLVTGTRSTLKCIYPLPAEANGTARGSGFRAVSCGLGAQPGRLAAGAGRPRTEPAVHVRLHDAVTQVGRRPVQTSASGGVTRVGPSSQPAGF